MSFDDFCQWLLSFEGQDSKADRHWISQYLFLYDTDGKMICDFVGRYESLDDDWKKICDYLSIPYEPLSQKGFISTTGKNENPETLENYKNNIKKNKYDDYFNSETKQLIYKRYKKDIEIFNYEFDK